MRNKTISRLKQASRGSACSGIRRPPHDLFVPYNGFSLKRGQHPTECQVNLKINFNSFGGQYARNWGSGCSGISNIVRRLSEHNRIKGKFTDKGIPWELVYKESYADKVSAENR